MTNESSLQAAGPQTGARLGSPLFGNRFTRGLARFLLGLAGWKVVGTLPDEPRYVLIVGPHTSNWDFILGVLAKTAIGVDASWIGKHTIFVFPIAGLLRWFGGEPVDRSASHGTVEAAIERFQTRPQWVLAMAPEGTRKRVTQWKTGFYRIAIGADVPILPVTFDFSRRVVDMGTLYYPVGDEEQDLRELRSRYRSSMARHPEQYVE